MLSGMKFHVVTSVTRDASARQLQVYKQLNMATDLPGGQKQPSMQCSSHNWDCSELVQESKQGDPHS